MDIVLGDREDARGLARLRGRAWDAIVDTCGYLPRHVEASASALRDAAPHYTFVSSISALADQTTPGADERAPVAILPADADPGVFVPEHYGALKALCERACAAAFAGTTLVVRPGLIVGPHDPTDRFTYWPRRMARGGDVLAPDPAQPVQIVDARDLAAWMLARIEACAGGTVHVTSPPRPLGTVLDEIRAGTGTLRTTRLVHVDDAFLLAHDVTPWTGLPLWLPAHSHGFLQQDVGKALATGLTLRPVAATARDVLAWDRTRDPRERADVGPSAAREAALLAAFRARGG